ncbi:hypothetical protein [Clostridium oryzae]|uniref:Uncharacterized protein n=1 Tax=Clostridium oryzae TaxID=1450648 RepID=A0A1V4IDU8_9CLOT|nr:hypothetical protein [Clostridium oryzae]OPJ57707.1 hypothetical protein CLORY_39770 [Clostridium oryzae]
MIRKAIQKSFIFTVILLFILSILNPVFVIKVGHRAKMIQGLYQHRNNDFDVVLLGSSHMNSSINPNMLWKQYGITSFNYGTGGQPIDVTYFLLKEILKNHKPHIVVVDLYYLGLTDEFGNEAYIRYVLDNMRFSKNKVEAIVNTTPKSRWIGYLFPILKYHYRWKGLKEEDFKYDSASSYYTKGFGAGTQLYGKNRLANVSTNERAEIPQKTKKYLYKFIELSKKDKFKLVFTVAPHDYQSTANRENWVKEPAKMFNTAADIAKENGISFVNYCSKEKFEEIGFDFKTDMFNEGHMNIWGSNKVTADFGKYLNYKFKLADHRGDTRYVQWENDYKQYFASQANVINLKRGFTHGTK